MPRANPYRVAIEETLPQLGELDLERLQALASECTVCPIHEKATQLVFGEGPKDARIAFVGEQPGDQEDKQGRPFVGPAGKLFASVLDEIGVEREATYITNVVKHFKWEPRGKRRLHSKPSAREVGGCQAWLEAELKLLEPELLVCLGSTAAKALFGKDFKVSERRGELLTDTPWAPYAMATLHPSALLRLPDKQLFVEAKARFAENLKKAIAALAC
jgi:uracil-DNA glycosylase family protein